MSFLDSLIYKIAAFNRKKKWNLFYEIIYPTNKDTILDVGYTEIEYSKIDNFLEKNYLYPENITALGLTEPVEFSKKYPKVKAVKYDGFIFPFEDKVYDICWSNAVLEHVGSQERQVLFLKEINRIAKIAYITTPNRYFPIEVHTRIPFLHFLPKKIFDKLLKYFNKEWAGEDYMYLLSLKDIKKVLKQAEIFNYKIIKNKLLFFTLDFIIIFGDNYSKIHKK